MFGLDGDHLWWQIARMNNKQAIGAPPVLVSSSTLRRLPGYLPGMRQQAVLVTYAVTTECIPSELFDRYDLILEEVFGGPSPFTLDPVTAADPLASRLVNGYQHLLAAADFPLFSMGRQLARGQLALPVLRDELAVPHVALRWCFRLLQALYQQHVLDPQQLKLELDELLDKMRDMAPRGANSLRFLQAADKAAIPWHHLVDNLFQFGWGRHIRWFESSFTDQTSAISTVLVRNKMACAQVLRSAGLPVPSHQMVQSEEQALQVAGELGYPVVVKPVALDGGKGVFAGLTSSGAVKKAYQNVRALGEQVLVEKHVEGNDYRVQVCDGQVFRITHRRSAYVRGDGESTVQALIDRSNDALQRPVDPTVEQGKRPIRVDEEVVDWLAAAGLGLQSVPPRGMHVRLRGAANVSLGGTLEPVLAKAHPDNLALAIRAVRVLRLDLAGVDLLIPDIARSWREVGAAICEVNARPEIGSGHGEILSIMLRGDGRIPVVGYFGKLDQSPWLDGLLLALQQSGFCLGLCRADGASLGEGEPLSRQGSLAANGVALLAQQELDGMLLELPCEDDISATLPVDRLDCLVVAGEAAAAWTTPQTVPPALQRYLPITTEIWLDRDDGCRLQAEDGFPPLRMVDWCDGALVLQEFFLGQAAERGCQ